MSNVKNKIAEIIKQRNIQYLFHFTPVKNIKSILDHGLYSRNEVDFEFDDAICLDGVRAEGMTDGICLSISFPNDKMFYSYRNRYYEDIQYWAVLVLDAQILIDLDCAFFPTNAANGIFRNRNVDEFKSVEAFEELFKPVVIAKEEVTRQDYLLPKFPTDVQAEVIVFDHIPIKYLKCCIFDSPQHVEIFKELFPKIQFTDCERDTIFFGTRDLLLNR